MNMKNIHNEEDHCEISDHGQKKTKFPKRKTVTYKIQSPEELCWTLQ